MPPASLSTLAVIIPGPTTARITRVRPFHRFRDFMRGCRGYGNHNNSRPTILPFRKAESGSRPHQNTWTACARHRENGTSHKKNRACVSRRTGGADFHRSPPDARCAQRKFKMFPGLYRMTQNPARTMYLPIALIVVLLDRWTKNMVAQRISLYSPIQILPGFFLLTPTENTVAAFSL